MEILPSHPDYKDWVLGDVYFGYMIPTVLCGRSTAFRKDICTFLSHWVTKVFVSDIDGFVKDHCDFGLASIGKQFKATKFSKILAVSPREVLTDVWQILWGVWADIFNSFVAQGHNGKSLLSSVGCIYLMFYLYHCQIGREVLPIPLSVETVSHCLDVCETTLDRFSVSKVADTFDFMFRRHCIGIYLRDGLQYIPQDRVGKPLGFGKKGHVDIDEQDSPRSD